jgi:hypothetical protein
MPTIGDRVRLASTKVGQAPRDGVVTGVNGALLHIKWSTGETSLLMPASGSIAIVGKARKGSGKKAVKRSTKKQATAKRVLSPKAAKSTTKKQATAKRVLSPKRVAKKKAPAKRVVSRRITGPAATHQTTTRRTDR